MQRGKTFEDSSISNFVFVITPTEVFFNHPNEHKQTLTLQKGMQTLGTLQQSVPIIKKQDGTLKHRFQEGAYSINFRVINEKNLNYQWSVYKVLDGGQLQETDCMQFSIQNFWKNYVGEYEKNVACLNIKMKEEKQHRKMLQIWKQISEQRQQKRAQLRVAFTKSDFRLDFIIQARSILDEQLEEYEKEKLMRKLREMQKSQIRRSAITMSNCGFQEELTHEEINLLEKIKRTRTEEGDKLSVPNTLSPMNKNYLLPIKQRNESLKKIHSNNQSAHKARFSDEILQISSNLHKSVKKASSFERRESIKEFDKEENLQLSSMIKQQKSKTSQASSNLQANPVESIKMFIFYTVLGLVMLWLLYNLMGHQSKVEYKAK